MIRGAVIILVGALIALGASPCWAQSTGGSFGGSNWGGSSSGGGGYHHDSPSPPPVRSSSTRSHGNHGSDYGSSRRRSDAPTAHTGRYSGPTSWWFKATFYGVLALFALVGFCVSPLGRAIIGYARSNIGAARRARELEAELDAQSFVVRHPDSLPWGRADVTALRVAIDWRARRYVAAALEKLARTSGTTTPEQLAGLVRQTVALLSSARPAWLYGGATSHRPMNVDDARAAFTKLSIDARSRFRHELIRAESGTNVEADAPAMQPQSHEGPGVVVVTLIVAATRELLDIEAPSGPDELLRALSALGEIRDTDVIAVEVVWSPAAEDDRMSTAELEALYADLVRYDGAKTGLVYCDYCSGPFAREVGECPHCGAPMEGVANT